MITPVYEISPITQSTDQSTEQSAGHALVIDDDVPTAEAIAAAVQALGHGTRVAHTLADARQSCREWLPELVLLDLGMPDGDGVELVREFRRLGVEDFIVISGEHSQARVVDSLRAGVADFLVKPVRLSEIHRVVRTVLKARQDQTVGRAMTASPPVIEPARLVGDSEAVRHLRHAIRRVAELSPLRAVITGAPGVGKRNIAASIHLKSGAEGRALYVNCAHEIDSAAELRFFGQAGLDGYLERARAGTLILDDLTQLPLALQARLALVLESGSWRADGDDRPQTLELALLAILREPVAAAMKEGRLDASLYEQLSHVVVRVPALIDREGDTLEIAERAIAELNELAGTDKVMSEQLRERLKSYPWPGNVVELKNALRSAHAGSEDNVEISVDRVYLPELAQGNPDPAASLVGHSFREVEKRLLLATLDYTGNNKRQAARILGISLKTLYNRLHAYE